jgi:hypothetical protein
MAIDFPASPSVNDTFSSGGVTYTWDGTVWASSGPVGFVQKAGDTMTGDLTVPNVISQGDVQMASQNGGQLAGFRNKIINGAMQVAQRGTSATATTSGYISLDRMRYSENSLATTQSTIEQSTDAPDGFSYSLKLTVTTAEGSVGADDGFRPIDYRIEGQDLQHLQYGTSGAKSLTLSFYVKSSVTGTYSVAFYRLESTDRLITDTYTINSANTWEYKTITIPGDTSASITNDNTIRFSIYFHGGAGTDLTSTDSSGSWGNYALSGFAFGNTVNLQNTVNSTWQATGIQLEVGTVATPFEHRSYGTELALCQRYYQVTGAIEFFNMGRFSFGTGQVNNWWQYAQEMRAAPAFVPGLLVQLV